MKAIFSEKTQCIVRLVCAVVIGFIMIGIYPMCMIPTASITYKPDGTYEWNQVKTMTLSAGYEVRLEYHPQRTMRFKAIGLVIDRISENADGNLAVSVYDSEDNIVANSQIALSKVVCRKKQIISLKTNKIDENSIYYISIKIDGNASLDLYLVDKDVEKYFEKTYVNEELFEKNILAELYTTEYTAKDVGIYVWLIGILVINILIVPWKKIGYVYLRIITILDLVVLFLAMSYYQKIYQQVQELSELKKLYMGIVIISVGILLLHAYVSIHNSDKKVEKCFFISVIGWEIIYLLLMPPYSYPDEPTHYAQSNAYVNRFMGHEVHDEKGQIYIREEELIDIVSFPSSDSLMDYYDGCFANNAKTGYGTMDVVNGLGLSRASVMCYIPFEIGIFTARVLGLNYVWSFTLSNMLGLLCYVVIVYIAVRLMPMGKWILFLTAQFPLALSMATSFTYDMINYALLTLFFALFCRLACNEFKINWKYMFVFAVIGVIVFPIKIAYLPFCLFVVLLPNQKFYGRQGSIFKIIFVSICIIVSLNDSTFISVFQKEETKSSKIDTEEESFDVEKLYKIREGSWKSKEEIIGDKSNIIKYTYNTLYKYLDYYWNGMIGMKIGWGDSFIPDYVYNIWWFLVLFSIIGSRERDYTLDTKVRGAALGVCILSFLAIYMAMLLIATPIGYSDCPSVGARYLLPILLPVCISLHGNKIKIPSGISDEIFIWGADLCQVVAVVYMFVGYVER